MSDLIVYVDYFAFVTESSIFGNGFEIVEVISILLMKLTHIHRFLTANGCILTILPEVSIGLFVVVKIIVSLHSIVLSFSIGFMSFFQSKSIFILHSVFPLSLDFFLIPDYWDFHVLLQGCMSSNTCCRKFP